VRTVPVADRQAGSNASVGRLTALKELADRVLVDKLMAAALVSHRPELEEKGVIIHRSVPLVSTLSADGLELLVVIRLQFHLALAAAACTKVTQTYRVQLLPTRPAAAAAAAAARSGAAPPAAAFWYCHKSSGRIRWRLMHGSRTLGRTLPTLLMSLLVLLH
jgi:hypothetical protein